jgi:hypothetical protein
MQAACTLTCSALITPRIMQFHDLEMIGGTGMLQGNGIYRKHACGMQARLFCALLQQKIILLYELGFDAILHGMLREASRAACTLACSALSPSDGWLSR